MSWFDVLHVCVRQWVHVFAFGVGFNMRRRQAEKDGGGVR
jgi:hypothetical protein